jgi:hypothetical protein
MGLDARTAGGSRHAPSRDVETPYLTEEYVIRVVRGISECIPAVGPLGHPVHQGPGKVNVTGSDQRDGETGHVE